MQYDYYAFRKERLGDHLSELEQASAELVQAKNQRDKNARQQAEKKIEQAAEKLVRIEPHLSYLWYEAQGSELKNPIRDAWQKYLTASPIPNDFHCSPNPSDLHHLPSHSFMLHVPFRLRKPYLSKDDRTFHLLDNSVRKDKVFQTPMIASTSWKGALRAALWQLDHKADDKTIVRLFGNAREDEKGQAGRLYFYPTFFDKIGLEVINPHDRKTGTGKTGPILLECVPANATGEFVLLYVPFGSVKSNEVAADLKLAAEGIQAMLTIYGFGAKTSSGFGIADIQGKGELAIRADLPDLVKTSPPNQKTDFLNDDGSLKQEFLNDDDGSFKTEKQYKTLLQSQGKAHESKLYKKAKQWWEANIEELVSESKSLQPITKVFFVGWDELSEQAQHMTEKLSSRGEV
jgi:CRISPR-associated protein Cmr2